MINLFSNGKKLLEDIPESLREELIDAINKIINNYREHKWEPSELNGGKLCEVVYTILKGYIDNSFPIRSSKPSNMVDSCRNLERASTFPRSIRIQIPRMLISLYEIRNNRGVGHIGGDVDPNHMDATAVVYMAKWVMAELIRVFHDVETEVASEAVDLIVERELPVLWVVNGKYRVLNTNLTMKQKTLAILYLHRKAITEKDLFEWVEHSNSSAYRSDVLRPLHKDKYVEYDSDNKTAIISPTGIAHVEDDEILEFN